MTVLRHVLIFIKSSLSVTGFALSSGRAAGPGPERSPRTQTRASARPGAAPRAGRAGTSSAGGTGDKQRNGTIAGGGRARARQPGGPPPPAGRSPGAPTAPRGAARGPTAPRSLRAEGGGPVSCLCCRTKPWRALSPLGGHPRASGWSPSLTVSACIVSGLELRQGVQSGDTEVPGSRRSLPTHPAVSGISVHS